VKRIRDAAGKTALVTAVLAVVLSGCSELSPPIIAEPYPASDGVNLNLPGSSVALRDFLVIGAEKGAPAEVIGAVVNDGTSEVRVSFQADLGEATQPTATVVTVGPNSLVRIGPDQKYRMEIPALPVDPGASTTLSAATTSGGRAELVVPVLSPELEYSDITAPPTTPAPTKTRKPKSDATPTDTPSPTDTETSN